MNQSGMLESILKPLALMAAFFTLAASAALWLAGRPESALGAWAGAVWMFLNLFVLLHLVRLAMSGGSSERKNRLFALSLVKFPVLYLAGFMILYYRLFPVTGIVTGLTAVMAAFAIAWMKAGFGREGKAA